MAIPVATTKHFIPIHPKVSVETYQGWRCGSVHAEGDHLHVQCTLGLGCFLSGAVAYQSAALGQAEVKGQQGAMLHADSPQGGAINLEGRERLT